MTPSEDPLMQELIDRAGRPKCPDQVVANIMAAVDADEHRRRRFFHRIRPERQLWVAAAVAALILIAVLPGRFSLETQPERATLTEAEIERVRADVETALAVISQSMMRSGHIVDDQIRENVTGQIFKGLRTNSRIPAASPAEKDNRQSVLTPLPSGKC